MNWIYWGKLYDSKFQANCLKMRIEHDWWLMGRHTPQMVEVFKVKSGKYGVRFSWEA
ncbi:hypothetical protein CathTA2_0859 [Caldalkalibacillus thermarum TA2.A1]|uniref:Uncharacterized protein n=1 Tax=Caldalkalibacillus thermarum (strain TA2.A1) TaxID=986075 RepID=F5L4Z6_CALTT|nr:hypothetical protein [Caldalkalibacillus thermarum]EGL83572.1 hypothetical protein CathTA2_0859 [Caldalkalibacillus thermarum TA2.A1]QZT35129.1 hypothetical protein HUR95_07900 [Caldalkalibacillus thermarum TA2.A1]GGK12695.1 hypothetical protein GCM10010965_02080 [Caldalkalibacillus thermarum]